MSGEENESTLQFSLQRAIEPGGGRFTERESMVYFKRQNRAPEFQRSYYHTFNSVGSRIAIVQKYDETMFERLGVDAIVEAPDMMEDHTTIYERTSDNMHGMTLYGNADYHPDKSFESIMFEGVGASGPLKAGFDPQEKYTIPLGNAPDGKALQLMIQDIRPMPALEIMTPGSLK